MGALVLLFACSLRAQDQLLFEPAHLYPAGDGPEFVVSGDVDGDSLLDLVAVDYDQNAVAVLIGMGDGTFLPPVLYGVGTQPLSAAIADLNNDQVLDLAVTHGAMTGWVSVLLGLGDGSFAPGTTCLVGSAPSSVAIADLNTDQIPDLVVANELSNNVAVLLGVGDGTFGDAIFYPCGSMPKCVVVGDIDDGHVRTLDLVTAASNADRIGVLLGQGDGTFSAPSFYPAGNRPWHVALGDVNHDGALDVVAAGDAYGGAAAVLINRGNGTFGYPILNQVEGMPESVDVGDFNLDGDPDILTANRSGDNVAVLLGHGDGFFAPPTYYYAGNGATAVAVDDYNGDQVMDLAVAARYDDSVGVLIGSANPAAITESDGGTFLASTLRVAPSPVRDRATIELALPTAGWAELQVFDLTGRVVARLLDRPCGAGTLRLTYDSLQSIHPALPAGVYVLAVDSGGRSARTRMTIVR